MHPLTHSLWIALLASCLACADLPHTCHEADVDDETIGLVATTADSGATQDQGGTVETPCEREQCPPSGNPCTPNICVPSVGCQLIYRGDLAPCDDGNPCTTQGLCFDKTCLSSPVNCEDGDPCTDDNCVAKDQCKHSKIVDVLCNDGSQCSIDDVCTKSGCVGNPIKCDDNDSCTVDKCSKELGCLHNLTYQVCDDSNPCTKDICVNVIGCTHINTQGDCGDGNLCTKNACVQGKCSVVGVLCTCAVNSDCFGVLTNLSPCEKPVCVQNACKKAKKMDGAPCEDGVKCTEPDICKKGVCLGPPNDNKCDDGIKCTDDKCTPNGCVYIPKDDRCDDKNPCTSDFCNPKVGCDAVLEKDGKPCNVNGKCIKGKCG